MDYKTLLVETDGEIMKVALNRPQKLNAMNDVMLDELTELCKELRSDTSVRFMIITGAGEAFSAGADLGGALKSAKEVSAPPYEIARLQQLQGQELMQRIEKLEQITIAAVNGVCIGAGLAIALACDFRIAAENAVFCVPETRVGIFFTWGCSARLVRLIGPARTKEMIMTCDEVYPREAMLWGLVNRVAPPQDLPGTTHTFVDKIAKQGPLSVRMTKKIVNSCTLQGLGDTWSCEPELVERMFLSGEPMEGFSAFLEKREPKFNAP
jgi:enoyl-CoA hydratase/carnithine racemase